LFTLAQLPVAPPVQGAAPAEEAVMGDTAAGAPSLPDTEAALSDQQQATAEPAADALEPLVAINDDAEQSMAADTSTLAVLDDSSLPVDVAQLESVSRALQLEVDGETKASPKEEEQDQSQQDALQDGKAAAEQQAVVVEDELVRSGALQADAALTHTVERELDLADTDGVPASEEVSGDAHADGAANGTASGLGDSSTVVVDDVAYGSAAVTEAEQQANHDDAVVTVDVTEDSLTVSDKINFEPNTAVLTARARKILKHLAETLNAHPLITLVEIAGHCSNSGSSSEANAFEQMLSEARAAAVVADLVAHGVAPTRLMARGYGDTRPVASNATAEGRARNRRVEFVILARHGEQLRAEAEEEHDTSPPATVEVGELQLAVSEKISFEPNTAALVPRAKRVLRSVAEALQKHPELRRVEVAGHCSDAGSRKEDDEMELRISEARAGAVVMQLVRLGVDSARLTARGYGDTRPVATNSTAEGRALNRRVEFVILERDPK
jgi:outer membrane protein OmpA-like peptidoglycan-associated protein